MRKPFEVLADGLISENSRADTRCSFPNDLLPEQVVMRVLRKTAYFTGELFYSARD